MIFSRDYQRPFWRGLLHAVLVVFYTLFLSLLVLSVEKLFGSGIGPIIQFAFIVFLLVVSVAVYAILLFVEPMKLVLHRKFRAGSIMMWSTLGWLLVFLAIFIVGLAFSIQLYS